MRKTFVALCLVVAVVYGQTTGCTPNCAPNKNEACGSDGCGGYCGYLEGACASETQHCHQVPGQSYFACKEDYTVNLPKEYNSKVGKAPSESDLQVCRHYSDKTCCDRGYSVFMESEWSSDCTLVDRVNRDCFSLYELYRCAVCNPKIGTGEMIHIPCKSFCEEAYKACSTDYYTKVEWVADDADVTYQWYPDHDGEPATEVFADKYDFFLNNSMFHECAEYYSPVPAPEDPKNCWNASSVLVPSLLLLAGLIFSLL